MINALTIDLEDWYHPEFVRKRSPLNPKPQIIDSTSIILKLLDKYNVKATFFVVGDIAIHHPELIREIYNKGHEIGFHGMSHLPAGDLNYFRLNERIKNFNKIIKKIIGREVKIDGFRAPTFSLNHNTQYVLKCLIKNGYLYDSSIVPANLFYYGLNNAPRTIFKPNIKNLGVHDNNSKIIEFPITIINFGIFKLPISGGFFLRILPYFFYKNLLNKINKKNEPFVIYFHPWEVFEKSFRIKKIGLIKYFITYFGINNSIKKIEKLLRDFKFEPMKNVIHMNKWENILIKRKLAIPMKSNFKEPSKSVKVIYN